MSPRKEKPEASDAIKREAVQFGVSAYLYQRELPPVKLERRGSDWILPKGWRPPFEASTVDAVAGTNTVAFPASKTGTATKKQISKIGVEMNRVGWSDEDGRAHLQCVYQKRSRLELIAAEVSEFIDHLLVLSLKSTAL